MPSRNISTRARWLSLEGHLFEIFGAETTEAIVWKNRKAEAKRLRESPRGRWTEEEFQLPSHAVGIGQKHRVCLLFSRGSWGARLISISPIDSLRRTVVPIRNLGHDPCTAKEDEKIESKMSEGATANRMATASNMTKEQLLKVLSETVKKLRMVEARRKGALSHLESFRCRSHILHAPSRVRKRCRKVRFLTLPERQRYPNRSNLGRRDAKSQKRRSRSGRRSVERKGTHGWKLLPASDR